MDAIPQAARRVTMRLPDEVNLSMEGQTNDGGPAVMTDGKMIRHPASLTEYPRMMYRRTDVPERVQQTDAAARCGATYLTVNDYGNDGEQMLCDTRVAHTATEAEALTAEGWEISPSAAYGLAEGLTKETSAKDDRIAELEAMLAERDVEDRPRRGRPPKQVEEQA